MTYAQGTVQGFSSFYGGILDIDNVYMYLRRTYEPPYGNIVPGFLPDQTGDPSLSGVIEVGNNSFRYE